MTRDRNQPSILRMMSALMTLPGVLASPRADIVPIPDSLNLPFRHPAPGVKRKPSPWCLNPKPANRS